MVAEGVTRLGEGKLTALHVKFSFFCPTSELTLHGHRAESEGQGQRIVSVGARERGGFAGIPSLLGGINQVRILRQMKLDNFHYKWPHWESNLKITHPNVVQLPLRPFVRTFKRYGPGCKSMALI